MAHLIDERLLFIDEKGKESRNSYALRLFLKWYLLCKINFRTPIKKENAGQLAGDFPK
jgi:hypothetical protein